MDIQGYIVEKLSGQSLPDFMRDHIYLPLGMRDAGFYVPADKRSRFATAYRNNAKGEMEASPDAAARPAEATASSPPCPPAAAAWSPPPKTTTVSRRCWPTVANSTASAFSLPATVKLMSSNHLPAELLTGDFGIGYQQMRPGFGYGYNCAVVFDPA